MIYSYKFEKSFFLEQNEKYSKMSFVTGCALFMNSEGIKKNIGYFDEKIFVKVRSTGKLLKSKLNLNNGKTSLTLLEDEYGISPGQACVFYKKDINGDKLLGGGWITN